MLSMGISAAHLAASGVRRAGSAPVQAMLDMFAYAGGVNGGYLDLSDKASLRQWITKDSAVVAAHGNGVGYVVDKSGNNNDVKCMTSNIATFRDVGGYPHTAFYEGFKSASGGGSGETPGGGFYFAGLVEPQGYYHVLWSDKNSAFAGREILYNPDVNGFQFDVGSGTNRVKATVAGIASLYALPPAGVMWLVQARHEGTTLYLKVNNLPEVTANLPTFQAGSNDYALSGKFSAAGDATGRVTLAAHAFSPLTPAIRNGVAAYVATKRGVTP